MGAALEVLETLGRSAVIESPAASASIDTKNGTAAAIVQRVTATAVQKEPVATVSMRAEQGIAGARGEEGKQGEPGPSGNQTQAFPFLQLVPALIWIVNHNLGAKPAITALATLGGVEMFADVTHVSENQLQVAFAVPTSGQLRCI